MSQCPNYLLVIESLGLHWILGFGNFKNMSTKLETFIQPYLKTNLPDIRPGDIVKVYQKVKEGDKERIQIFEGVVIARKHGREMGATIMVRKISQGIGVERIFPIHSPLIEKIEIVKRTKVRRAKLYYLRKAKGERVRLKVRKTGLVLEGQSKKQEEIKDGGEEKEQKQ